jgi:alkanesulfonate monooxygenase SsuD/methylene tetrahydromethanopterin reductase-like flavin-dependent oxidoreductase (luciferase family)
MALYSGEVGLQFTTHIANHYTVPQWIELAELAHKRNFDQLWVNDNLGYRNVFVILTAIASRVPIKLGTAILVPYFRNPVDTADAFAALSELVGSREISVGIARGDYAQAGNQINLVKPIGMVKETVHCIKSLFEGKTICYRDYPVLSSFYQLRKDSRMHLRFSPKAPVRFYSGGNGPKIMRIAGQLMDGVLIGGFFIPLVRSGKLRQLLQAAELGGTESNRQTNLRKVCEINVSVSNDYERARIFPKRYIAHMLLVLDALGFSDAEFGALNIDPEAVKKIKAAFAAGGSIEDVAPMITDAMVDAGFIVGRPRDCVEKLQEMCSYAQDYGFDQICLAKLGPDYKEAITVLAEEILPSIVQRRDIR